MHIEELIASIQPLDKRIMEAAQARFDKLIKPVGSLAKLESMTSRYAAMLGSADKAQVVRPDPRLLLLFGDMAESARLEQAFRGKLPVVVVARQVDAQTCPALVTGTSTDELLEEGALLAAEFAGDTGAGVLMLGALGAAPRQDLWQAALKETDAYAFLEKLNSPVITALCGAILQGAARRLPLVLDGVLVLLAARAASLLAPAALDYCLPGHVSAEAGCDALLEKLGMDAPLRLRLPDSSGVGACQCLSLLDAGVKAYTEMETFDEAGVHDEMEAFSLKVQQTQQGQQTAQVQQAPGGQRG